MKSSQGEPDRVKGLLVGFLGGAAGVLAMGAYWGLVTAGGRRDPRKQTAGPSHAHDSISLVGRQHKRDESSTAAVGRLAYEAVTGGEPSGDQEETLSNAVHWGFGTLQGGLYGAARAGSGWPDLMGGAAFGTLVWLSADELGVPILGLSEGPTAYPAAQHAHRLGAHLAYGVTVAAVTQALRRLF